MFIFRATVILIIYTGKDYIKLSNLLEESLIYKIHISKHIGTIIYIIIII